MRTMAMLFAALLLAMPLPADAASGGTSSPDPSTPLAKGQAAIEAGDFAAAMAHLETAVDAEPENADAWNLLGFACRKSGDLEKAERAYARALTLDAEHTGALEYLGMLYVETGRLGKAEAMLARIDGACFFGCEEYDELKRAIETAKAK